MKYSKQSAAFLTIFLCLLSFSFLHVGEKQKSSSPLSVYQSEYQREGSMKTVLLLTPFVNGYKLWDIVFQRLMLGQCPNNRCLFITDEEYLPYADAVIFYGTALIANLSNQVIENKINSVNKKQIWIFMSYESPTTLQQIYHVDLSNYNGLFNWTLTYRWDSDVVSPYGKVVPRKIRSEEDKSQSVFSLSEKFNDVLAVSMISKCKTSSKREDLIEELRKFMPIDVYGECGNKRCGASRVIGTVNQDGEDYCNDLVKKYYFYLAFENSICKDYVTEKFYRSLHLGIVPVVLGGANYSAIAPPNSFIKVDDFPSVSDLADYLSHLAKNPEMYNKYLQWKNHYTIELYHPYNPQICDLCSKLHSEPLAQNTYEHLNEWFDTESKCSSWTKE